jgi:phosphohistidine phosphatase SixA
MNLQKHMKRDLALVVARISVLLAGAIAHAQELQGKALVTALQHGGYVILMRHANSPRELPTAQTADPENVKLERQLDEEGRTTAVAFGKALRDLKIPIGKVFSSPTYRALEMVRYSQLPNAQATPEIGDNGTSMQNTKESQAAWLQKQAAQFTPGTNTIIITHQPNIAGAFPQWSAGLAEGEALILAPDGNGGAKLVARLKIEEWPKLAN